MELHAHIHVFIHARIYTYTCIHCNQKSIYKQV